MKHDHFSAAVPARLRGVLICALVVCLLAVSFSGCQAADLSDVPETSVPSQASSISDETLPSAASAPSEPTSSAAAETSAQPPETETASDPVPPVTEHVHTYVSQVTPPTCTTGGFTTYTCSCGYSYNSNSTAPLGHTWSEWKTDVPATTTQTGQESRVCTVCGEEETRVLDLLPQPTEHSHVYAAEVHKPTCTEAGYTIYTCSCGDTYQGDMVDPLGHTWGEWTEKIPATETTAGLKVRVCSACGAEETQTIDPITSESQPHTHSYTSTEHPASCTQPGYILHECACGVSYKTDETSMLAHQWVTDPNGTTHTCTGCGKTETIAGAGSGSTPSSEPSAPASSQTPSE